MDNFSKVLMIVIVLLYIVSPVDLCPGPLDDVIVILLAMASSKKKRIDETKEK